MTDRPGGDEPNATVAAIEALLTDGRRLDAERLALDVARDRPRAVYLLGDLAGALLGGQAPVSAERLTRLALVQLPDDVALCGLHAVARQLAGHAPGETARAFGRMLALTPQSAPMMAAQAEALLDFGALDRARDLIRRARAIDPAVVGDDLARRAWRRPRASKRRRFDFLVVPFLQSGAQALHRFIATHPDVVLLPANALDAELVRRGPADLLDQIQPTLEANPDRRFGLVQHAHVAGGWSDESVADRLNQLVEPDHVVLVHRDPFELMRGIHANQLVHRATRFSFEYAELPWPRGPVTALDGETRRRMLAPSPPAACFAVRRPWSDHRQFLREFVPGMGFGRAIAAYRRVFPTARALDLRLGPASVDGFMAQLFAILGLDPAHRDPSFRRQTNPLMARFLGQPQRLRIAFDQLGFDVMLLPDWRAREVDDTHETLARIEAGTAGLRGLDDIDLAFAVPRGDDAVRAALEAPMIREFAQMMLQQFYLPLMRNNFDAVANGFAPHRVERFAGDDEELIARLGAVEFRRMFDLAPELAAAWPRLAALVG
jgi:hypothetical protein